MQGFVHQAALSLLLLLASHETSCAVDAFAITSSTPSMVASSMNVDYSCTLVNSWSAMTHPVGYPGGSAHWSPPVLASHSSAYTMWAPGIVATTGVENVAELGTTGSLVAELNVAIGSSSVLDTTVGSNQFNNRDGPQTLSIDMDAAHSLLSVITMVAPSPDWFSGFYNLNMVEDGTWIREVVIDMFPWDAGTEEGTLFSLGNAATSPREEIFELTVDTVPSNGVFLNPAMTAIESMGTWTCSLLQEDPVVPDPTTVPMTPAPITPAPIATPAPITPSPVTPAPIATPAPITPAPVTPAPIATPAPVTPAPIATPAPITPAPIATPAPITPAPITPAPNTQPPGTPAPNTQPPGTPAPNTQPPGTPAPNTQPPGTPAPNTQPPGTPAPNTQPPGTPAPITPAPITPSPATPPPAGVEGGDPVEDVCFSGEMTVDVKGKGLVAMKDLQVGDHVKTTTTGSNDDVYEPIYMFGHHDSTAKGTFVQLSTAAAASQMLELSPKHLVFVGENAIPAGRVKIGDYLQLENGATTEVRGIKTVTRQGLYAPFTLSSGKILVNGILSSSYISMQGQDEAFHIGEYVSGLSHHEVNHFFTTPLRFLYRLGWNLTNKSGGISAWVPFDFGTWVLHHQSPALIMGMLSVVGAAILPFYLLEQILILPTLSVAAACFAATIAMTMMSRSSKTKSKLI